MLAFQLNFLCQLMFLLILSSYSVQHMKFTHINTKKISHEYYWKDENLQTKVENFVVLQWHLENSELGRRLS